MVLIKEVAELRPLARQAEHGANQHGQTRQLVLSLLISFMVEMGFEFFPIQQGMFVDRNVLDRKGGYNVGNGITFLLRCLRAGNLRGENFIPSRSDFFRTSVGIGYTYVIHDV